jgi:hypothetical protein
MTDHTVYLSPDRAGTCCSWHQFVSDDQDSNDHGSIMDSQDIDKGSWVCLAKFYLRSGKNLAHEGFSDFFNHWRSSSAYPSFPQLN